MFVLDITGVLYKIWFLWFNTCISQPIKSSEYPLLEYKTKDSISCKSYELFNLILTNGKNWFLYDSGSNKYSFHNSLA